MNVLTKKQELFSIDYAVNSNEEQASIAAGYTERNAKTIAAYNLKQPHIIDRIKVLKDSKKTPILLVEGISHLKVLSNGEGNEQAIEEASKYLAKQEKRMFFGIYETKGILTNKILHELECNNAHKTARCINDKILKYGMQLICIPQNVPESKRNSYHWYLCAITLNYRH